MGFTYLQQPFRNIVQAIEQNNKASLPYLVTGIDDSARALLIAQVFKENPRPFLIIESNLQKLQKLQDDLQHILVDYPILTFPVEEALAAEFSQSSLDSVAERVAALNLLVNHQAGIVISTPSGLRKQLSPAKDWQGELLNLQVGQDYEIEALIEQLNLFGYQRQKMVLAPGEFSVRGGIIDYFPLNEDNPIRLDFFDTELDGIRYFDAESQESLDNIEETILMPATDVLLSQDQEASLLDRFKREVDKYLRKVKDKDLKDQLSKAYQHESQLLEHGNGLTYPQAYLSWIYAKPASLVDYLPAEGLLIVDEFAKLADYEARMDQENAFWLEQEIVKGRILPNLELKHSSVELIRNYPRFSLHLALMQRGFGDMRFSGFHHVHYRPMNPFYNQMALLKTEVDHWLHQGVTIQILAKDLSEARHTLQRLEENDIEPVLIQDKGGLNPKVVNITLGDLSKGFELPLDKYVLISSQDLYKKSRQARIRNKNLSNAERIKSYNELKEGDYVVHIAHGIGQYKGLETMVINGIHKDLLVIEYQDQARVMIPVEQIDLLQKYVGSEHKQPKVHKLGGTEWVRTKQKVQASVEDIADELIELYAKRQAEKGYAFSPDTPEQDEFEAAFPYVETEDQLTSSQEIKADMEKVRPMDRLLVGDVGYGKTEVAMRAIFKAVMDGKQVAFLVPTTILAQQHYHSLVERFQPWPFEIGLLSRFVPASQQKETLNKIKDGAISIVIGTHRLLSKDVQFHDLGLLIVDEEQRFGVKHKERLKQLKAQVDVLTLTATPIPRTLHMSMIGIRDLSLIETPPNNRFPVQTYVMEQNEGAIKSAIEREIERGGQVFYLYNRVASIYHRAQELADLVPGARIAVAHGQMSETELELVLLDFIEGQYDVLVTTTIIETGVDIPNANTLFVENADKMGLSTLYQLRGRVGRTHRVAYAYLMYSPLKQLTEVSEKRLNAIKEFTELGSGFKIAMRDLSIRGAGNLLGQQQSGFIDSVGYEMYAQMLQEAVNRRKQADSQPRFKEPVSSIEWNIDIEAYLPATYIEDEQQKIAIYQSIQKINGPEAYRHMQDQLIDRFGEYPDEVANLLDIALIRSYGQRIGLEKIETNRRQLTIYLTKEASSFFKGPMIFQALQDIPLKAQVQVVHDQIKLTLDIYQQAADQWLNYLIKLSQTMDQLINKKEEIDHASR
ncbi:transcription-repair coupling factor [Ignavigranum ruoffiae]|uniref:transcription-repair coupling factor n=1 Tax=Ignavigranum ruoffiae TaxID=89093 RepID=UPI002352B851|nr:transcription-repair coupling factor [Ignavigranum ruoffiae]